MSATAAAGNAIYAQLVSTSDSLPSDFLVVLCSSNSGYLAPPQRHQAVHPAGARAEDKGQRPQVVPQRGLRVRAGGQLRQPPHRRGCGRGRRGGGHRRGVPVLGKLGNVIEGKTKLLINIEYVSAADLSGGAPRGALGGQGRGKDLSDTLQYTRSTRGSSWASQIRGAPGGAPGRAPGGRARSQAHLGEHLVGELDHRSTWWVRQRPGAPGLAPVGQGRAHEQLGEEMRLRDPWRGERRKGSRGEEEPGEEESWVEDGARTVRTARGEDGARRGLDREARTGSRGADVAGRGRDRQARISNRGYKCLFTPFSPGRENAKTSYIPARREYDRTSKFISYPRLLASLCIKSKVSVAKIEYLIHHFISMS
ncbi:uncharacterized protein [Lolium perenne]|uniref:uncharacterized protein n=1 Tax=Lolium perenne TaxID=4522 RepID=UPI003A98D20E